MTVQETLKTLASFGSKKNVEGMKRYNIATVKALGVSAPDIRKFAKKLGTDHALAIELLKTEIHEARILAALLADPQKTTLRMLDQWADGIQNWAQCDNCCAELFQKTKFAHSLPFRWVKNKKEFVRRAGIVMIAEIAVHHKNANDSELEQFFPLIKKYSIDERNFVKKGVNWALRQIGKRNLLLQKKAIALSKEILNIPSPSSRWIALDALKELQSKKTIAIIKRRRRIHEQ